jgi:hypothetical protein
MLALMALRADSDKAQNFAGPAGASKIDHEEGLRWLSAQDCL